MLKKTLLVLLVLVVAAIVSLYVQNNRVPELGVVDGKLKPLSSKPNCVSTQAEDESKRVATLAMKKDLESTRNAIFAAIESFGGAEIQTTTEDYIYAVFVTPTVKYRDDVEFWIDTQAKEVHYRSSSRAGYGDGGLNRQRYNALAAAYNQSN